MQSECNAWSYNINFTTPNPKILRKSQKFQKIWKTSKIRSQMHEKEEIEDAYQVIWTFSRPKRWRVELKDLSEWEVFGAREKGFLLRERSEKWIWFAPQIFKEIVARWIEVFVEICWALNLNRCNLSRCCPKSVGRKNASMDWEAVEDLSARKIYHNFISMDWRSCRASIEKKSRKLDGSSLR